MEVLPEDVHIREASLRDLPEYTKLLQRTYESAYVDESIGFTKEKLSEDVFNTESTQNYLKSKLAPAQGQRTWLARRNGNLIGAITVTDHGHEAEISAFYVAPEHQGKGLGKQLWNRAVHFAGDKDIVLDLFAHNTNAIEMYRHLGFEIDTTKGENGVFHRHWEEWPEGYKVKAYYMRRSAKNERGGT